MRAAVLAETATEAALDGRFPALWVVRSGRVYSTLSRPCHKRKRCDSVPGGARVEQPGNDGDDDQGELESHMPITTPPVAGRSIHRTVYILGGMTDSDEQAILKLLPRLQEAGVVKLTRPFAEVTPPFFANHMAAARLRGRDAEVVQLFAGLGSSGRHRLLRRLQPSFLPSGRGAQACCDPARGTSGWSGVPATVLSGGRWVEPYQQFLGLLEAIAGPDLRGAVSVVDFLGMWKHLGRRIEGPLADFAWRCLVSAPKVPANETYYFDQLAATLAPEAHGAG